MYDILRFLKFVYSPQITKYIFFILMFLVIKNILLLFYIFFGVR